MKDYSYRGKETIEFDIALSKFTGSKYVLSTNTGTAALHLCYMLSEIYPGDEVIVPALTFVGTVNPLIYIGATPNFIDLKENDVCLCPDKLESYLKRIIDRKNGMNYNKETGRIIKAIVPVHVLGNPCDMSAISEIAKRYDLKIIEDACQALGSYYKGIHMGNFGYCSALSFNGNKIITTGGGGALLTNNEYLYRKALHLSMTAKDNSRKQTTHTKIGYNYRMPAWNAKLGLIQFRNLKNKLKENRIKYQKLSNCLPVIKPVMDSDPNFWRIGIIGEYTDLKTGKINRLIPDILNILKNENIQPFWKLISGLPMYKNCPRDNLNNSERIEKKARFI